jgi:hypothetical protein
MIWKECDYEVKLLTCFNRTVKLALHCTDTEEDHSKDDHKD